MIGGYIAFNIKNSRKNSEYLRMLKLEYREEY